MGISEEFSLDFEAGAFDPATLGVCIRIGSSLAPLLRPTLAAALFRPQTEFGRRKVFRQAYRHDLDEDTEFALLSYSTLWEHELRHFHEFLATPYGQSMMFTQLELYAFTSLFIPELSSEKSLVVPLSVWSELSDQDYRHITSFPDYGTLRRYPPQFTAELLPACLILMHHLESISEPQVEGNPADLASAGITVRQLMEGSAINVQLSALGHTFEDEDITGRFWEHLKAKDKQATYTKLVNWWYNLEQRIDERRAGRLLKPLIGYGIRNAVTFFSLCATTRADTKSDEDPTRPDNSRIHPGHVFTNILAKMSDARKIPAFNLIVHWLDKTAEEFGLLSLKESLLEAMRVSRLRAEKMRGWAEVRSARLSPDLLSAYDKWLAAQEYMCEKILEDPLRFFEPRLYYGELERWVGSPAFILTDFQVDEGARFFDSLMSIDAQRAPRWNLFSLPEPIFGARIIDVDSMRLLSLAAISSVAFLKVRKTQPAYQELLRAVIRTHCGTSRIWEA